MKPKLEISQDFTLEDIRKIRDYNYEMTKDMNTDDMIAFYKKGADCFRKDIEEYKAKKRAENDDKN